MSLGDSFSVVIFEACGSYTLRCVLTDATVLVSGPLQVTGTAAGAATGYRPMPDLALGTAVSAYTAWVTAELPGLLTACRRLDADVARGDLAAAKTDWLTAHPDYERLGAADNAFCSFDVVAGSAGEPRTLLRTLTTRIRFLTAGGRRAGRPGR
jgi:iron uptake system EfeUOB component EfeO/EfeM